MADVLSFFSKYLETIKKPTPEGSLAIESWARPAVLPNGFWTCYSFCLVFVDCVIYGWLFLKNWKISKEFSISHQIPKKKCVSNFGYLFTWLIFDLFNACFIVLH